jgi:catechol 1,2-dioxygenase
MLDCFKPITTQIFDSEGKYLDNDSVFAVKDSLVVRFVERKGDSKAQLELKYDVLMVPMGEVGQSNIPLVSNGIGSG